MIVNSALSKKNFFSFSFPLILPNIQLQETIRTNLIFLFQNKKVVETNFSSILNREERVDMRVIGIPLDQKMRFHLFKAMFLDYLKITNIVVFSFSLVSPVSLQRVTRVIEKISISFKI